ncbi:hypothetical protein D9M72_385020 [compost metagenome]
MRGQDQLVAQGRLVAILGQVLHMHPDIAMPLQVEQVHVAMQRHALKALHDPGIAPERRVAGHLEAALQPFFIIHAARARGVGNRRQLGGSLGIERERRAGGDKLRAEAALVAHEALRMLLVFVPEFRALLVETELGQQLRDGAVGDVVAGDHHRRGHAGTAQVVVGQRGVGRLHGVGQHVHHHIRHALLGRHIAHPAYQPRQQHAVAATLVQPAIDGIARQVGGQPRHQLVQPWNHARLRRVVDIVQRQHLEHQRAFVLRLAQRVERAQRLRIEQLARHQHIAVADAVFLQLPRQRRPGFDHRQQGMDQRLRNLEIHVPHSR